MTEKIKLAIFVHDLHLELGHSRALIEQIRNVSPELIKELRIYTYTCTDVDVLFPKLKGKIYQTCTPVKNIYPFLLKEMFYHLWSNLCVKRDKLRDYIKIGIGTACLNVDVVNIQFVQSHWEPLFFKFQQMNLGVKLYKKIMYFYFRKCEEYLFKRAEVKIYVLSQFVFDFMRSYFKINDDRMKLIYSGVNFEQFSLPQKSRFEIFDELKAEYPVLGLINPHIPVYLFVGAYERKGLGTALAMLETLSEYQLIVIGEGDSTKSINFSKNPNRKTVKIKFTRRIADFYFISDCFIFPSIYEPFGLVILEAAAMGLQIITRKEMVGASELLENLRGIYFIDDSPVFKFPSINFLSEQDRSTYRKERLERFSQYSWKHNSEQLIDFIT